MNIEHDKPGKLKCVRNFRIAFCEQQRVGKQGREKSGGIVEVES